MSEQKRASLTSLGSTKKDKKSKEVRKTVRFTLTLAESNEEACPEFNYRVLLGSAERKRKAAHNAKVDGAVNGLDPYASDDEDKLKDIARQFEEKYGGGGTRKRHGRFEDYVDLGAGYDENDPFIDNTDAYDEIVPEEITTAHGGFYINCGQLEFKEVVGLSDGDEERDSKIKKPFKKPKIKRTPLRGTNSDHPELVKKRKFVSHEREFLKKKKKLAITDLRKKGNTVKELLREKRNQLSCNTANSSQSTVVPEEPAPHSPRDNLPIPNVETKTPTWSENKKAATAMSIDDAIESVVSAARSNDDSSQDSSSSVSKSGSGSSVSSDNTDDSQEPPEPARSPSSVPITLSVTSSTNILSSETPVFTPQLTPSANLPIPSASPNTLGNRGEETQLPSDLPQELVDLVQSLKKDAEISEEGKCKFFSYEVNQKLLRVELLVQTISCSRRQRVYSHLALFLPCTKDTLMKRAKKLRLSSEELKLKEPMARLEAAIGRIMPGVLDQYTRLCRKVAEEKSAEEEPPKDRTATNELKSRIPRKTFPWDSETRLLLQEVVSIKRQCFLLQKPRKESIEELLRTFLEQSVKPLWPPGWMRLAVLCREAQLRSGSVSSRSISAHSLNSSLSPAVSVVTSPVISTPSSHGPKPRKSNLLRKTSLESIMFPTSVTVPTNTVITSLQSSIPTSVSPPIVSRSKVEMQLFSPKSELPTRIKSDMSSHQLQQPPPSRSKTEQSLLPSSTNSKQQIDLPSLPRIKTDQSPQLTLLCKKQSEQSLQLQAQPRSKPDLSLAPPPPRVKPEQSSQPQPSRVKPEQSSLPQPPRVKSDQTTLTLPPQFKPEQSSQPPPCVKPEQPPRVKPEQSSQPPPPRVKPEQSSQLPPPRVKPEQSLQPPPPRVKPEQSLQPPPPCVKPEQSSQPPPPCVKPEQSAQAPSPRAKPEQSSHLPLPRVIPEQSLQPSSQRVKTEQTLQPSSQRVKTEQTLQPSSQRVRTEQTLQPSSQRVRTEQTLQPSSQRGRTDQLLQTPARVKSEQSLPSTLRTKPELSSQSVLRTKSESSSQAAIRKADLSSMQPQVLQSNVMPTFSASNAGNVSSSTPTKSVKSVIERVPSKGLDLSITGVTTRPVLTGSPTKLKGSSEISIIPMGVPSRSSLSVHVSPPATPSTSVSASAGLPLINIPDCISVTPTMPPPPTATSVGSSVRPMSLKQRILLDTGNQRSNSNSRPPPPSGPPPTLPPLSPLAHRSDDGIEVIEITEDGHTNVGSLPSPRVRNDQPKKKIRLRPDIASPQNTLDSSVSVLQVPSERDAETDAATDLLSQIIHESQPNYSNTQSVSSEVPTTPTQPSPSHHRSVIQRPPRSSPPKPLPAATSPPVPSVPEQGTEVTNDPPQPADAEESVQMEVDRVMKELIELQGHFSGEKETVRTAVQQTSTSSPQCPIPHVSSPQEAHKISSAVSVVPVPSTLSVSNSVSSSSSTGTICALPRGPEITCTPLPRTRPSPTVNNVSDLSSAARFAHSFQEEFQKHLFQEVPHGKGLIPKAGSGASDSKKHW